MAKKKVKPTKQVRGWVPDYEYVRRTAFHRHVPMQEIFAEMVAAHKEKKGR